MGYEHAIARYRNLYAKLLRFYPKPYRERFQEPMEQTFNDICRERAAAGRGIFGLTVWLCVETAEGIMRQHIEVATMRNKGIVRAALVTAGVLLIPLWGNTYIDGWNWHWYTFVLAAAVLFSAGLTYELVARTMSNRAYRFAVGLAVVTALVLTWTNLLVGLIGEENPANLMYVGVIAIGIIGATIARLQARGMARALFGTAIAQMLVPIIALVFWKANFAPGLNGLFAMLFVASALLFQRAARTHT